MARVVTRSYRRPGKLLPQSARHFKGRSIRLPAGEAVEWHSPRRREEVILIFRGSVSLEVRDGDGRIHATRLTDGRLAFITPQVWHRVVNRSRRQAHYLYITA